VNDKIAADNAFKDLTDFHNGPVSTLKSKWHATGMEMQGEIPVDLGTFNGLREAWLKDTGESPPASMDNTFKQTAEKVTKSNTEYSDSLNRLSQEIDQTTKNRKLPPADDLRETIADRMKNNPCRT
jgi:hypothetical protein